MGLHESTKKNKKRIPTKEYRTTKEQRKNLSEKCMHVKRKRQQLTQINKGKYAHVDAEKRSVGNITKWKLGMHSNDVLL